MWQDGQWTLECSHKLLTGSEFDLQFDDLKKAYLFGVAAFNPKPAKLVFEQ